MKIKNYKTIGMPKVAFRSCVHQTFLNLQYHCCGRYGSNDYINLGQKADDLPPSCCKDESCKNPANLYTDGCLSKVEEAFAGEKQLPYLEWIVLVFNVS